MSKRIFLTLPDAVAEDLERWAQSEGNKAASLAGFLVEQAVRLAQQQGKIPSFVSGELPQYENLAQLVMHSLSKLVESDKFSQERLKALMRGKAPTEVELLRIALICDLSEEYLLSLLSRGERSNGDKAKIGTK